MNIAIPTFGDPTLQEDLSNYFLLLAARLLFSSLWATKKFTKLHVNFFQELNKNGGFFFPEATIFYYNLL